jgi:hypothetical protein
MPKWRETFSEWTGCAGLGLIPLICMVAVGFLTNDPKYHDLLLDINGLCLELVLFCVVTNAASIVLFVSKFNLIQAVTPPRQRTIPTGFIFSILSVTLICGFVFVVVIVKDYPALIPTLVCLAVTLPFSVFSERRISVISRA